jgi:hypothetical protein
VTELGYQGFEIGYSLALGHLRRDRCRVCGYLVLSTRKPDAQREDRGSAVFGQSLDSGGTVPSIRRQLSAVVGSFVAARVTGGKTRHLDGRTVIEQSPRTAAFVARWGVCGCRPSQLPGVIMLAVVVYVV